MPPRAPSFDLQSHSSYSDGELAPAELVSRAAEAGVELLSLTDHDTVDGVDEAVRSAGELGIAFVAGVEISSIYEEAADLHMLGYRIDIDHPPLLERLARSRAARTSRAAEMVSALQELGYAVDEDMLRARSASGKPVGRPHIAQAVVSHPANASRLAEEQLADASAFLEALLIEGRPAFRAREAPTAAEAMQLIHDAGGYAVWAHPFWDFSDSQRVLATIAEFVDSGLDGIEAFYATHTAEQTALLAERSAQLGLFTTGSSDFHGPRHRLFNRFRAFDTYGLEPQLGPLRPGRCGSPGAGRPCA